MACAVILNDRLEPVQAPEQQQSAAVLRLLLVFAFAAFLQVDIENTVASWLPTYALRTANSGIALAAAASSFYWAGFLLSRGLCSLLLLRTEPMRIFRTIIASGLLAALLLVFAPNVPLRNAAMFILGASLAPTYPLVLSRFFARARQSADSRWILFTAGFGGSVLPWMAGFVSAQTGSIRSGMLIIPTGIVLIALLIPALKGDRPGADRA